MEVSAEKLGHEVTVTVEKRQGGLCRATYMSSSGEMKMSLRLMIWVAFSILTQDSELMYVHSRGGDV